MNNYREVAFLVAIRLRATSCGVALRSPYRGSATATSSDSNGELGESNYLDRFNDSSASLDDPLEDIGEGVPF